MPEYTHISKENAGPMLLIITSLFLLIGWIMVTVPDLQLGGITAFQISLTYIVFLMITFFLYLIKYAAPEAPAGVIDLGPPEKAWLNVGIGVAVGVFIAITLIATAVYKTAAIVAFSITAPLVFLFVGIISPVVEELFWRGFLTPTLSKFLTPPVGIGLSALSFALYHLTTWGGQGWVGFLTPFAFALILSLLTLMTESVATAICVHAATNITIAFIQIQAVQSSAALMFAPIAVGIIVDEIIKKRKMLKMTRMTGLCPSPPSRRKGIIFGVIYLIFAVIGIVIIWQWLTVYRQATPGTIVDAVTLGIELKIPYEVFSVLIPCHIVLIPWTIVEALAYLFRVSWAKNSAVWMLLIALPLTTTENVFSWYLGGSVPIYCICMFDAILDFIAAILG